MERYVVQPSARGGFEIFDRAVNGATGPGGHTRAEADQVAAKLELLHQRDMQAREDRLPRRRVEPPVPVLAQLEMTMPGLLHMWGHSIRGWSGEVELLPDRRIWVPADRLEQRSD